MKPEEYSYRSRLVYHSALLGSFALVVSSILVIGDQRTANDIQQRKLDDMRASLLQVIPQRLYDNDLVADTITITEQEQRTVYRARKDGKPVAIAFVTTTQGYSGPVDLVIGIDNNGDILGVRVIAHSETPGLGDKMETGKSDWILDFNGHSLANTSETEWKVKKDGGKFDQFTGATITPRAIVRAVHESLAYFTRHQVELYAAPPIKPTEDNIDE